MNRNISDGVEDQKDLLIMDSAFDATAFTVTSYKQTDGGEKIENTANCYVVDASGYYTIPLVYGNAIKDGVENKKAYAPGTKTFSSSEAPALETFIKSDKSEMTGPYIEGQQTIVAASRVWAECGFGAMIRPEKE